MFAIVNIRINLCCVYDILNFIFLKIGKSVRNFVFINFLAILLLELDYWMCLLIFYCFQQRLWITGNDWPLNIVIFLALRVGFNFINMVIYSDS